MRLADSGFEEKLKVVKERKLQSRDRAAEWVAGAGAGGGSAGAGAGVLTGGGEEEGGSGGDSDGDVDAA